MSGLFISFEGSEGCGKSTQIEHLRQRLEEAGHQVVKVREPGGTTLGESVRQLLLQPSQANQRLCPTAELLLFAASRAQLVHEIIHPALDRGDIVIADRFLDSTTVYQGFGRGLDLLDVSHVNDTAVGTTRPVLTFLLDMDATQARGRALARSSQNPDRIEQESPEFFEKIRAGYLQKAKEEPHRIHVIDAQLDENEIAARIWALVQKALHA